MAYTKDSPSDLRDPVPNADASNELELTIDDLAAHTGVPTRTIRFYQAKGVLPSPERRGRIAVYRQSHIERLKLVGELQDRGLRLKAIQDLLRRTGEQGASVDEWLGLHDHMTPWSDDAPREMNERELQEMMRGHPPGTIARLTRAGAIEPDGPGLNRHYRVPSPALLNVALQLSDAGIEIEVAVETHRLLQKRLARAADDVVQYLADHVGKGFGRSAQPDDLREAIKAMRAKGMDAVQVTFSREVDRAIGTLLQQEPSRRRRR